nr:MAG TPA: hypothetical protein [Caudoviricetes sp.]
MSNLTKNYKLQKPLEDDFYDINITNSNMDIIDKGLTLDVGTSKGTGNNYILDIGSITLAESNKGVSFKFFADKDSTGAVTINTNYNLIKANKNPVKNLKSGAPYIITYDGGSNFFLASGADDSDSTSVGTDGSNVLAPNTYIGSDGEVHTGIMPNRGSLDKVLSLNETFNLPAGYYRGGKVTQNIPNNGAINASLNCGQSKSLPAGYISGGTITANSLASQTPANADASTIIAGRNAWVNGNLITGNAMKAKSIATIETITRNGIGWTAGGTVEITFNTPFDILLVGSYIIVNNGQLQMNYLPAFSDNRIVLSISDDRRTLYMRNTNTSCGWNSTIFLFSINYKE